MSTSGYRLLPLRRCFIRYAPTWSFCIRGTDTALTSRSLAELGRQTWTVTAANAGVQSKRRAVALDSRLRGNDTRKVCPKLLHWAASLRRAALAAAVFVCRAVGRFGDVPQHFRQLEAHVLFDALEILHLDRPELAEAGDDLLNELLGRRRAGRQPHRLYAHEPCRVDVIGVVDQIAGHVHLGADLAQAIRIRTVGG